MTRTKKILVGMLMSASLALVSAQAFAADPPAAGDAPAAGGDKAASDYGYKFTDDPLSAGGFGPNDARILVRPQAARTTLIRPRTSFVPEMLKSVENI